MDVPLLQRALATACLDGSLAVITGLLLASRWLRPLSKPVAQPDVQRSFVIALPASAALLAIACCAHLYLLTADFSGQSSLWACLHQLPNMLATHPGKLDIAIVVTAFALLLIALLPLRDELQAGSVAVLLVILVILRATTGHAAADSEFSVAELLQFLHLASMAVWSGAILVSGIYVLPKLAAGSSFDPARGEGLKLVSLESSQRFHAYLNQLSWTSTAAVILVLLTGLLKSYRTVGVDLRLLRSAAWGYVLIIKIVCVVLAVGLGGLNRFWLQSSTGWTLRAVRRSVTVLRCEAACMAVVLGLSALLGNLSPPSTP